MTPIEQITVIAGQKKVRVELFQHGDRVYIKTPYNPKLVADIKGTLSKPKWHGYDEPPVKMWSANLDHRTMWGLRFLQGLPVYAMYDKPLEAVETDRPLYKHQLDATSHILTRHMSILAGEMGTGKTLAALTAGEILRKRGMDGAFWYVGPRSGVEAFRRECLKWRIFEKYQTMTYEGLVKVLADWPDNQKSPRYVIFDESSKIKTPTAKRSQSALHLSESMRDDWGDDCWITLLTGTPAPLHPTDWWQQCEVARPGYLYENSIHSFRDRLAILEDGDSATGGVFKKLVRWKDSSDICKTCGDVRSAPIHMPPFAEHVFSPCINEVYKLYSRLSGLVLVQFKKDCLDLPDKTYHEVWVKPTVDMLRAAASIRSTSPSVIVALTRLRTLADGFQYEEGKEQNFVGSPKFLVLDELLDEYEDVGRLVIWAGFKASIDNVSAFCRKQRGWHVLIVDGRGFRGFDPNGLQIDSGELLSAMDGSHPDYRMYLEKYPRLAFVGNPKAGGMALTLTAAPAAIYFSNPFDADARIQSEDRIHRAGMDAARGAKIIDILCLDTDKKVLDNLKQKRRLQDMSLGELHESPTERDTR